MDQLTYLQKVDEFIKICDLIRLQLYKETGYEWIVVPKTGANRSIKEQHGLYIKAHDGLDNDGDGKIDEPDECVTKADGGQSPHNFNLARDIVPLKSKGIIWWDAPKKFFEKLGEIAKQNGLVWGGDFKSIYDPPHVEYKSWKEVQSAWKRGEIQVG